MARLNKLAETSNLMEVDITYNGKRYRFNLFRETQINQRKLNGVVKDHASSYSFLTQLHNNILYEYDLLEKDVERTYAKLYIQYKESNSSGRAMSDELCKQKALASKTYKLKVHEFLKMKFHKNQLEKAIRAFETRAFLIQTLSANVRKEV